MGTSSLENWVILGSTRVLKSATPMWLTLGELAHLSPSPARGPRLPLAGLAELENDNACPMSRAPSPPSVFSRKRNKHEDPPFAPLPRTGTGSRLPSLGNRDVMQQRPASKRTHNPVAAQAEVQVGHPAQVFPQRPGLVALFSAPLGPLWSPLHPGTTFSGAGPAGC